MTTTRQINPIVPLIENQRHSLMEALSNSPLPVTAFETSLRSAVASDPKLAECVRANPQSTMLCVMQAAQLGLRPGNVHGHFYLIPRQIKGKLTCTSVVGYRGLIDLALRSGQIEDIDARCIYRGEAFDYNPATGEINHPFKLEDEIERSEKTLIGAYAWAYVRGRTRATTCVLRKADIDARRKRSAASSSGPWVTDYEAMARKSALRALIGSGLLPLGEMVDVLRQADGDEEIRVVEAREILSDEGPVDYDEMPELAPVADENAQRVFYQDEPPGDTNAIWRRAKDDREFVFDGTTWVPA